MYQLVTRVYCRFVIGREKNPGESEVARLIEQSIAEDKVREDLRQRQQDAARQVCRQILLSRFLLLILGYLLGYNIRMLGYIYNFHTCVSARFCFWQSAEQSKVMLLVSSYVCKQKCMNHGTCYTVWFCYLCLG